MSLLEYISIYEVLNEIADAAKNDLNKSFGELELSLQLRKIPELFSEVLPSMDGEFYVGLFRSTYRESWAAGKLEAALHNGCVRGDSLEWYEFLETGFPRLVSGAKEEYLVKLKDVAKIIGNAVAAHCSGKSTAQWPNFKSEVAWAGKNSLRGVGFERKALFDLLDREGIAHTFDRSEKNVKPPEISGRSESQVQITDSTVDNVATAGGVLLSSGSPIDESVAKNPEKPEKWVSRITEQLASTLDGFIIQQYHEVVRLHSPMTVAQITNEIWLLVIDAATEKDGSKFLRDVKAYHGGAVIHRIGNDTRPTFNYDALRQRVGRLKAAKLRTTDVSGVGANPILTPNIRM